MFNENFHAKEEWDTCEAPLKQIDIELYKFAKEIGASATKNNKFWPERSIKWDNDVRCLIQIYLANKEARTYSFWICASKDEAGNRFWKRKFIFENVSALTISGNLTPNLNEARKTLIKWAENREELELATKIGKLE